MTTFKHSDEGKKPFKCDICNANFWQNVNLNTHVATVHEGMKPFQCDICNANFGKKSNLNSHIARAHERKKLLKCGTPT